MDVKKGQKIKAQEWVVMFDGQIKRSEKEIDSDEHHLEVNSQEEWIDLKAAFILKKVKMFFLWILLVFKIFDMKRTIAAFTGKLVLYSIEVILGRACN